MPTASSPQPSSDRVRRGPPPRLIAFNKPFGVLCQFSGEGRPTLAQFIAVPGVYPAGRLDADSEGLLLLTDSGPLQARISHPRHKLAKTYWVQVEGSPTLGQLASLRQGLRLNDGLARALAVEQVEEPTWLWPRTPPVRFRKSIATAWLRLSLDEGRNRQVRRMTAAAGLPTLRLIRGAIGPVTLGGLAPGQWRELPVEELGALFPA